MAGMATMLCRFCFALMRLFRFPIPVSRDLVFCILYEDVGAESMRIVWYSTRVIVVWFACLRQFLLSHLLCWNSCRAQCSILVNHYWSLRLEVGSTKLSKEPSGSLSPWEVIVHIVIAKRLQKFLLSKIIKEHSDLPGGFSSGWSLFGPAWAVYAVPITSYGICNVALDARSNET